MWDQQHIKTDKNIQDVFVHGHWHLGFEIPPYLEGFSRWLVSWKYDHLT